MKNKAAIIIISLILSLLLTACSAGDEGASGQSKATAQNENASQDETAARNEDASQDEGTARNGDTSQDETTVKDETAEQEEFQPVDASAGGWNITIENMMRETSMKNAAVVLGYSDTATNEFEKAAPEGKEFFLVKMSIEKEDAKEDFKWDKLILTDADNNAYRRMDDIFIEDLGMKRIAGTDLNFGSNVGWIAFEINQGAAGLTLQYEFENDKLEYTFE